MFKPLAVFIGLRYTRSKKKNQFVSFISFSSMLGIGLGVMVLITVLSVMNGFDTEIHRRFFGMTPEITLTGREGVLTQWQEVRAQLEKNTAIRSVAPFVSVQSLLTYEGQVLPVMLMGILPELEEDITHLQHKMVIGHLKNLSPFGIVLGQSLAEQLGVMVGESLTVMIPEATVTPAGMIPRFKRFTVKGIFSAGNGFNFDTKLAFIHLKDAQKMLHLGEEVSGLKIKIKDIYQAKTLSLMISKQFGDRLAVENWTDSFGAFFQAVKMEKNMMFLILLLIIAVAAFNLVSSLVMVVNDKQSEIAILRTIGATPAFILRIFMIQGMLVGVLGTLFGVSSGLLVATHTTAIVNALQSFFGVHILSSSIYWVDYLPSVILWADIWKVSVMALLMSFLATLYPAWRASKTVIAEALHYE